MAEDMSDARPNNGELFTRAARANNNNNGNFDFDFDRCGRYVDKVKPMLGHSLEGRICSGLKEFVCNPNSRYSRCFPCVKRWLDRADAFLCEDTGNVTIKRASKDGPRFANYEGATSRVDRTCRNEVRGIIADRNELKSVNVRRYINEKDYWLSRSCANGRSVDVLFKRENECPKWTDRSSDLEVEVDSCSERIIESCAVFRRNKTNDDGSSTCEKRCACTFESDRISPRATKTRVYARRRNDRTSSKLKLLIYQTTNEDGSTALKVTSVSVPCRPDRLIVRIFEAVPWLSESCLVLTRRKFENGIRNACSRLNGILSRLDNADAKELRLVCEIRPGHIDLILRRPRSSKPRLFLARLPTCRSHPKRDSCRRRACNENSCEEDRPVAFQGSALTHDSTNATSQAANSERELSGERMNFGWTRKPEKEVSFCFANLRKTSAAGNDGGGSNAMVSDRVLFIRNVREASDSQELMDKEKDTEIIPEENVESCDSESPCYSDSLRKFERTVPTENSADIRGPREYICCVPRETDDRKADENDECPGCPESRRVAETSGRKSSFESCSLGKGTSSSTEIEDREIGNSVSALTKKVPPIAKRSVAEIAEKFNADFISSWNRTEPSRGSKCSCCGEDLSDAERNGFGSLRVTISIESKASSSKTEIMVRADDAIDEGKSRSEPLIPETMDNNVDRRLGCSSASRPTIPRTSSIQDRSFRVTTLYDRPKSSYKMAIHEGERSPTEAEGDHERVGRTNAEDWPNVSDLDNLSENDFRRMMSRRPGSPRRRSPPRSKSKRTSRFAIRDSRTAQDVRATAQKNYSDCICKNRCCSFPAASLDRLKYLIRKKLRRLLLEERNKGTNTSKTFLKNERYFVSASSGKLNEGRVIRDTCSNDRHGQRVRGRTESGPGQAGETAGSDVSGRKKTTLDRAVKERCRKITRCGVFKRIKVADLPRVFSPRRGWKFIGTWDSAGEAARGWKQKSAGNNDDNSTKILLVDGNARQHFREPRSEKKLADDKLSNKRNLRNEQFDGRVCGDSATKQDTKKSPRGDGRARESSTSSREVASNKKSKSFKGWRYESDINRGEDYVILYTDYERYVNDICADFRLKLLQYVALCKTAKDTLSKRLRSDACVVRSNST